MAICSRRKFLKIVAAGIGSAAALRFFSRAGIAQAVRSSNGRKRRTITADHDLVAVKGSDPAAMTRAAVKALGGMAKFVPRGSTVVVKPNIGWDRSPETGANTNPDVVAALVEMCYEAGAKRVNVFDNTCNTAQRCYETSGIRRLAESKGARVYHTDAWNFVRAQFPYESPMEGWPVFRDAIECDTFINVPVLKHHGLTGLTLGMKNLMGVCGGSRGQIHFNIGRKLVDMADFIKPELTVIDGFRYLARNGPTGGNLADVLALGTVIASPDITLADVYAARLVGRDPNSIPYIANAIERGLGSPYYAGKDVVELSV
ncbi:MAG TPA: DUF362 domain-containing protein [Candidatus Omnitrophota bacterium]|nr:DUF362 domain-containing protein [Candidatus Omnitrophota bacterium]HQJ15039.1 DUF362 domain-containing protein [Candidatus Omnitrophota bacterium]